MAALPSNMGERNSLFSVSFALRSPRRPARNRGRNLERGDADADDLSKMVKDWRGDAN